MTVAHTYSYQNEPSYVSSELLKWIYIETTFTLLS